MNSISQNLKKLRKENNLTQQQMAEKLSVTHQTVSNWESGRSMPGIDALTDIAKKLDTDISFLLYGKKENNENLKQQIKRTSVFYFVILLIWLIIKMYMSYRQANGVNVYVEATVDMWYLIPGRTFSIFFAPFLYICPAVIFCQILKLKGFIKNITNEKIFNAVKYALLFILINRSLAGITVMGFTKQQGPGMLYQYLPQIIKGIYSRLYINSLMYPWIYSIMGVIYEMCRPFTNGKITLSAYSPGRINTIARNIKKLRIENNLTQQQLAERLFVTRQTISNWENGKIMPDVNTLMQISQAMEVDLNTVLYSPSKVSFRAIIDFSFTVLILLAIFVLFTVRSIIWDRVMRNNVPYAYINWYYHVFLTMWQSIRGVLIRPVLWFTVPVFIIQLYKLTGRLSVMKGFKYRRILMAVIIIFMVLTAYNYIPYMIKVELKKAFHLSKPILWLNYPSFDWLIELPQWLKNILYYICTDMKWMYSVLGVIFEMSKPHGAIDNK